MLLRWTKCEVGTSCDWGCELIQTAIVWCLWWYVGYKYSFMSIDKGLTVKRLCCKRLFRANDRWRQHEVAVLHGCTTKTLPVCYIAQLHILNVRTGGELC
jgi:hypothetical protein